MSMWTRRTAATKSKFGYSANKGAIPARDCCVAKSATFRADRLDPSLRKDGLLRVTTALTNS